jgi:hypothetical protein
MNGQDLIQQNKTIERPKFNHLDLWAIGLARENVTERKPFISREINPILPLILGQFRMRRCYTIIVKISVRGNGIVLLAVGVTLWRIPGGNTIVVWL